MRIKIKNYVMRWTLVFVALFLSINGLRGKVISTQRQPQQVQIQPQVRPGQGQREIQQSLPRFNRFTQIEAYFQVPKLRELVTKTFKGNFEVVRYMDVISRMMAKEAEYRDTHWAFYHGITNVWTVPQEYLYKAL